MMVVMMVGLVVVVIVVMVGLVLAVPRGPLTGGLPVGLGLGVVHARRHRERP
ncbi:hypothetical protein AB0H83_34830 [Dactylosporangium sp. NPDC050688]|uniref:hypothetical protein n=1 Tax=Dactylosporangium sp. NPDC050688 TaxID=3157217 RepID=UPI0033EA337A